MKDITKRFHQWCEEVQIALIKTTKDVTISIYKGESLTEYTFSNKRKLFLKIAQTTYGKFYKMLESLQPI